MIVAVIISVFIDSIINTIIFLIGLRSLDRYAKGEIFKSSGLWIDPKQAVLQALWFVPSITLVTTLLNLYSSEAAGCAVWVIALKLVYKMERYELMIFALLFTFVYFVTSFFLLSSLV